MVLRLWIVIILLLGCSSAIVICVVLQQGEHGRMAVGYKREENLLLNSVKSRIACSLKNARTLAAALTLHQSRHGTPPPSRMEFAQLVKLGNAIVDGVYGISWIPRVLPQTYAAFLEEARTQYPGNQFQNSNGSYLPFDIKPPPGPDDSEYMIVYLIQPEERNWGAIGFNLFSNPARKNAMEKARDQGISTVTARIVLQQEREGDDNYGVLYITPVYDSLVPPVKLNNESRRLLHNGYVNGVIRIEDFIRRDEDSESVEQNLEWFLYDETAVQEGQSLNSLLYADKRAGPQAAFAEPQNVENRENLLTSVVIDVADREWRLMARPRQIFVDQFLSYVPIIWLLVILVVTILVSIAVMLVLHQTHLDEQIQLERSKLLDRLLPKQISDHITHRRVSLIAEFRPACCTMFMDVEGFTAFQATLPPRAVLGVLRSLFSILDELCADYGVEKIKTVGDCYMAANGLFGAKTLDKNGTQMLRFALKVLSRCQAVLGEHKLNVRFGVNGGEAICGVLGGAKPHFDIWGDSVNVASRLESTGVAGKIQVGQTMYDQLWMSNEFRFTPRENKVHLKGKGDVQTWFVTKHRGSAMSEALSESWV